VGTPFQIVTMLVVDDVRTARRVASRLLNEEGFRVLEADGAEEALEVLGQASGRVDLVLMDVVMPNQDGVALAGVIAEEWPGQRVLFMSAHPAEVLARHGLEDLNVTFLAKPYSREELLAKVREALGRHPPGNCEGECVVERRRTPRLRGK
jgi:two-component system cell cycle sensor histidine kinase/response regulator CckA